VHDEGFGFCVVEFFSSTHDSQGTIFGAGLAAGDGRIDKTDAAFLGLGGQLAGNIG
jgi:hypothetical protein